MKFPPFISILLLIGLFACGDGEKKKNSSGVEDYLSDQKDTLAHVQVDLGDIRARDTLRAITIFGPTSYFLYRGQAMGFEYDILAEMASKLDMELKIIVCENIDELFDLLNSGHGDLVAYGLTVTQQRKEKVEFSIPYRKNHQVLVQAKPENWRSLSYAEKKNALLRDVTELGGKRIAVRERSSYASRLRNLSQEIGDSIIIDYVPGELSTYEIIQGVSDGEYEFTIADNNIAELEASYLSNIDASVQVSLDQNIAWAFRKSSPELKDHIDSLLNEYIGSATFNIIYAKYFESNRSYRKRVKSDYYSLETGKVSPYDELIQKYNEELGWDWRLLASLIYQESHFDPKAGSWAGASGLMQLMPATAKSLGVSNRHDPSQSIHGGTKYLRQIYDDWESIPDSIERIKFTMASYNCGPGHVQDAQRLAIKYGADSLRWENGVDEYVLKLSNKKYYSQPEVKYGYARGKEPYNYVKDIFARYDEYRAMLP